MHCIIVQYIHALFVLSVFVPKQFIAVCAAVDEDVKVGRPHHVVAYVGQKILKQHKVDNTKLKVSSAFNYNSLYLVFLAEKLWQNIGIRVTCDFVENSYKSVSQLLSDCSMADFKVVSLHLPQY